MRHEKRIVEAFKKNGIQRILVIDDGYDAPPLDGNVLGELIDFLENTENKATCADAGLPLGDVQAAKQAALDNDTEAEELLKVNSALYARFVSTRDPRFDPGKQFNNLKGATLDVLAPLEELLKKCGEVVEIKYAGLDEGEKVYRCQKPQVVFLDYYLSPEVLVGDRMTNARVKSINFLGQLLNANEGEIPAIVLMSSEGVKDKVEQFRQEVKVRGRNKLLALRFRFLQKSWIKVEDGEIKIANEAADALLDTAQEFVFGQVLQCALSKWQEGADKAMNALLQEISDLTPKDFAYLLRFRLVDEGVSMSDYLEWLFGESLRALVDEHVPWRDQDFTRLDDLDLSKGIEGAFDGPSVRIAKFFHRIRIDEHKSRPQKRHALGDIYICTEGNAVRGVLTPDCDLVVRKRKRAAKVRNVLTMGGELRSFDQDGASADQFVIHNEKPYSLKWDPKDLVTFPLEGKCSLRNHNGYQFAGTLRPLYAQAMQRQSLTDMSRVGLEVAPVMGIDAEVTAWLRVKNGKGTEFENLAVEESKIATILLERADAKSGHKVLLRRTYVHALFDRLQKFEQTTLDDTDGKKLAKFLKEENEDTIIKGLLIKGSLTKDKGPLGTRLAIAEKPDKKPCSPWLQLLLKLSEEAMKELLTIDPRLPIAEVLEADKDVTG
ncbi:MAG: hypothetical protein GDA36_06660 [Rhodobacteraceae bacterium]|nr:hypothetical protein [Paracoccaceae bacterium]